MREMRCFLDLPNLERLLGGGVIRRRSPDMACQVSGLATFSKQPEIQMVPFAASSGTRLNVLLRQKDLTENGKMFRRGACPFVHWRIMVRRSGGKRVPATWEALSLPLHGTHRERGLGIWISHNHHSTAAHPSVCRRRCLLTARHALRVARLTAARHANLTSWLINPSSFPSSGGLSPALFPARSPNHLHFQACQGAQRIVAVPGEPLKHPHGLPLSQCCNCIVGT
ncbi:hypothetical protein B0H63DRAFT_212751 [Podospora didyma]|uniref:Uncharacterized protein n=1 Tax=Podospora didyma TaxID=330526 RepID=A0AAE0NHQ7_9PEZI|nr:hypothetical protein B0H63DRAFT_212751 [Podospora didyma]